MTAAVASASANATSSHISMFFRAQLAALRVAAPVSLLVCVSAVIGWIALLILCRGWASVADLMTETGATMPYAETTQVFGFLMYWLHRLIGSSGHAKHTMLFNPMLDTILVTILQVLVDGLVFGFVKWMRFWSFFVCLVVPATLFEPTWHAFHLDKIDSFSKWLAVAGGYYPIHFVYFSMTLFAQAAQLLVFSIANMGTRIAMKAEDTTILSSIQVPVTLFLTFGPPLVKAIYKRIFHLMPHWKEIPATNRQEEIFGNVKSIIFDTSLEGAWSLISKLCIYRSYSKSYYLCTCGAILLNLAERLVKAFLLRRTMQRAQKKVANQTGVMQEVMKSAAVLGSASIMIGPSRSATVLSVLAPAQETPSMGVTTDAAAHRNLSPLDGGHGDGSACHLHTSSAAGGLAKATADDIVTGATEGSKATWAPTDRSTEVMRSQTAQSAEAKRSLAGPNADVERTQSIRTADVVRTQTIGTGDVFRAKTVRSSDAQAPARPSEVIHMDMFAIKPVIQGKDDQRPWTSTAATSIVSQPAYRSETRVSAAYTSIGRLSFKSAVSLGGASLGANSSIEGHSVHQLALGVSNGAASVRGSTIRGSQLTITLDTPKEDRSVIDLINGTPTQSATPRLPQVARDASTSSDLNGLPLFLASELDITTPPSPPFSPLPASTRAAFIRLGLIEAEWASRFCALFISALWLTTPPSRTWTSCVNAPIPVWDLVERILGGLLMTAAGEVLAFCGEMKVAGGIGIEFNYDAAIRLDEWGAFSGGWRGWWYMAMAMASVVGVMIMADAGPFMVGQVADPACYLPGRS